MNLCNWAKILLLFNATITLAAFHHSAFQQYHDISRLGSSNKQVGCNPEKTNHRILICPGFGYTTKDYTGPDGLVSSLVQQGWNREHVNVLDIKRSDWFNVFLRGISDFKFWQGDAAPTRPAFRWYLDLIAIRIQQICSQTEKPKLVIIGHSAGGWLCRAALGFLSGEVKGMPQIIDLTNIKGLVTLGTPHIPPPPGIFDISRGALRITNEMFPGAYFSPAIRYITVIGCSIEGRGLAFDSYQRVCGDGGQKGDGFVPFCAGHLDGAIQINLQDVGHYEYGIASVVKRWHDVVVSEILHSHSEEVLE
mmetsp:Transcript_4361/g.8381  ORF Transcript_4361/g.8381 Transcript_4361/m.8381 type:complete len:307 (-) Transcript_4361:1921-2841(-)